MRKTHPIFMGLILLAGALTTSGLKDNGVDYSLF